MPTYICQDRYSREAIQEMVKSPEDRTQVVAKLMKGVGGKLLDFVHAGGLMSYGTDLGELWHRTVPPTLLARADQVIE